MLRAYTGGGPSSPLSLSSSSRSSSVLGMGGRVCLSRRPPRWTLATRPRSNPSSTGAACPATRASTRRASSTSSRSRGSIAARTRQIVYHPERLRPRCRPRACSRTRRRPQSGRREFDFFPVVDRSEPRTIRAVDPVAVRRAARATIPAVAPSTSTRRPRARASVSELDARAPRHPERGMPFGFPPLDDDERAGDSRRGCATGSGGPARAAERDRGADARDRARGRRSSTAADREVAHRLARTSSSISSTRTCSFDDAPGDVVPPRSLAHAARGSRSTRSRRVRPYDDPGRDPVYYRLRRIRETLVEKTHAPYALSDAKLARASPAFYDAPWERVDRAVPVRSPEVAANPFVAFAADPRPRALPVPARRRALPRADVHPRAGVPRPGGARRDRRALLIFFLAPESDPAITDPGLPRQHRRTTSRSRPKGRRDRARSTSASSSRSVPTCRRARSSGRCRARTLADIWNGDGTNPDAVLTVFRHFDNAFVLRGAIGGIPKTAWVLDYPIFERMYYDLVAGFDVYGNVVHQVGDAACT